MPLRRSRRISLHQPENLERMKRFESHGKIIYHEEAEDSEREDIKITNLPLMTETEEEEDMEDEVEPVAEESSKEVTNTQNTGQSIY